MNNMLHDTMLGRLLKVIYKLLFIIVMFLYYIIVSIPVLLYLPIEVIGIMVEPTIFALFYCIIWGKSYFNLIDNIYGTEEERPLFITSYPIHKYICWYSTLAEKFKKYYNII